MSTKSNLGRGRRGMKAEQPRVRLTTIGYRATGHGVVGTGPTRLSAVNEWRTALRCNMAKARA